MTEEFLSLMGSDWRKEFTDLKAEFADITKLIAEFNKGAKAIELNLVNAKNIGDAIKLANDLKLVQRQLQESVEKGAAKGTEIRNREAEAVRKATAAFEKQRLEEIRLQKQREEAFDRYEKKLAKEQAAKDKASQQAQAAADAESRATKKLSNDYELLKAAYNAAAAKAKNYGVTLGTNSEQFNRAATEAKKMYEILVTVETAIGQSQRLVGQYASGFNPLRNAINQLTREAPAFAYSLQTGFMAISNNLPILADAVTQIKAQNAALRAEGKPTVSVFNQLASGLFSWGTALSLGITLLTVFGKEIGEFVTNAFKTQKATDLLAESTRNFQKAVRESAAQELASAQISYKAATDVTLGYKTRMQAAKDLQDQYHQIFGNLSKEAIMAGEAAAAYDDLTNAIVAKAAVSVLQKELEEAIKLQMQLKDNAEAIDKAAAGQAATRMPTAADRILGNQKASETFLKSSELGIDSIITKMRTYMDMAAKITRPSKDKKQPKLTDLTNETLDNDQNLAEERTKYLVQQIQENLEVQKTVYENEQNSYEARLQAAENYNLERINQLRVERAGEIKEAQIALDQIADIEKKAKPSGEEKALLAKKAIYLQQQKTLNEKYNAEEAKTTREGQQRITALFESEYSKRKAALATNLAEASERISEQTAMELELLAERYSKGQLSQNSYQAEAARIRNNYHVLELQDQLALVDAEIANRKQYLKDTTDLEKQAADIRKKINDEASKANIAAMEMEAEARRSLFQQIGQLAQSIGDAVAKAIDGGYQRQMDQLEARKKGIQDALEVELAAIEATTFAGVAQEEKIAIAKANAADKEKQIANEQEAIENRRKELNRLVQAAAITGQAIQTGVTLSAKAAEASAQALLLAANPLTAAYAPIAAGAAATITAQIPIVAGIAAAQIAALYAYKDGTDDHPVDSFALVGDGYRKEVVETPDGRTYITPDRPTPVFLEKHSKVFPSVEEYMQRHQMQSMSGTILIPLPQPNVTVDVSGLRDDMKRVEKAIRNQRPVILRGHNSRFDTYYRRARA